MNDGEYPYLDSVPTTSLAFNEPYPIILMTQSDGEYPKFESLDLIGFSPDYPIILMTQRANEYPKYEHLDLIGFSSPYPIILMVQKENDYPFFEQLDLKKLGAFSNAKNLTKVKIPRSVKKIGPYAFRNTALTSVTIASDCEYNHLTSFPDGCQINFYEDA